MKDTRTKREQSAQRTEPAREADRSKRSAGTGEAHTPPIPDHRDRRKPPTEIGKGTFGKRRI